MQLRSASALSSSRLFNADVQGSGHGAHDGGQIAVLVGKWREIWLRVVAEQMSLSCGQASNMLLGNSDGV